LTFKRYLGNYRCCS